MMVASVPPLQPGGAALATPWLDTWRRYMLFTAIAHLAWEFAQLPLYTLWYTDSVGAIAVAVVHCTGGDVLIAAASLMLALLIAGSNAWPAQSFGRVAALATGFGAGYTVFSEWLNTAVRQSWAYAELMPTLPLLGTGLSPLLQWLLLPPLGLWWVRRGRHALA